MPIYEYQCRACGKINEALQKISDPVLTECAECGQHALEKIISKTSFQLKGGGWYVTDFRGDKKQEKATEAKNADADTSAKETSTSNTEASSKDTSKDQGAATADKKATSTSSKDEK